MILFKLAGILTLAIILSAIGIMIYAVAIHWGNWTW